jgi:hypothetical protein
VRRRKLGLAGRARERGDVQQLAAVPEWAAVLHDVVDGDDGGVPRGLHRRRRRHGHRYGIRHVRGSDDLVHRWVGLRRLWLFHRGRLVPLRGCDVLGERELLDRLLVLGDELVGDDRRVRTGLLDVEHLRRRDGVVLDDR